MSTGRTVLMRIADLPDSIERKPSPRSVQHPRTGRFRRWGIVSLLSTVGAIGATTAVSVSDAGALTPAAGKAPSSRTASASAADTAVLTIRDSGGFVFPSYLYRRLPTYTVTAARQLIRPADSKSGSLLIPASVKSLTGSQLSKIEQLAKAAGLDQPNIDFGTPMIADAPVTVLTYRGVTNSILIPSITTAEAFGPMIGTEGGSTTNIAAQLAARNKLQPLLRYLESIGTTTTKTFVPTAVAVHAQAADPSIIGELPAMPSSETSVAPIRQWPYREYPLESMANCRVISGKAAAPLIAFLKSSKEADRFSSNNVTYTLWAHMVLPGDAGCGQQ